MSKFFTMFRKGLSNDTNERRFFNIGTYIVLFVVALTMTIINISTKSWKDYLTICTGAFSVACLIKIAFTVVSQKFSSVATFLFAIEVVLMFTFFLVTGNPEGFSAIWICMMPSLGMVFFDRVKGSIICGVMLSILIFFLWTPFGKGFIYEYTETFKMRFPILFIAFYMLALFLETLRVLAYKEVQRMESYYKFLSDRDPLTGLLNRQGMYSTLNTSDDYIHADKIGVVMFDIDFFKSVNDNYGHDTGDEVLKNFARIIQKNLEGIICRWGGEEFVVIFKNDSISVSILEQLRRMIEKNAFSADDKLFSLTVSIGMCEEENFDIKNIDALINKADDALYEAKNNGRNRTVKI